MTSKLTRGWLKHQISAIEAVGITDSNTLSAFKLALAAMDSEPLAYIPKSQLNLLKNRVIVEADLSKVQRFDEIPLYRHAQPAPVVPEDVLEALQKVARMRLDMNDFDGDRRGIADCLGDAEEALIEVVNRRAAMLQAGSDEIGSWANNKNTPASPPITPAAPDKKLTDDVLDEIIAGAKTSMEQYLALSLKAEREVWRKEGPTDDERIMAIEGIHNCERCGDEGWVVGERCACGQDGNSPVIPDGYVMVPKVVTPEIGNAINEVGHRCTCGNCSQRLWDLLLSAAPQPQNEPQNIPEIIPEWIPVSERMPDENAEQQVLACFKGGDISTLYYFEGRWDDAYGIVPIRQDVTHWMPLPAGPREINNG